MLYIAVNAYLGDLVYGYLWIFLPLGHFNLRKLSFIIHLYPSHMLACLRFRIARLIFLHLVMYMYMHHDWKLVWFFFINFFFNCYNIDCLFYWKRLWKKIICLHQKNKNFPICKTGFLSFYMLVSFELYPAQNPTSTSSLVSRGQQILNLV